MNKLRNILKVINIFKKKIKKYDEYLLLENEEMLEEGEIVENVENEAKPDEVEETPRQARGRPKKSKWKGNDREETAEPKEKKGKEGVPETVTSLPQEDENSEPKKAFKPVFKSIFDMPMVHWKVGTFLF